MRSSSSANVLEMAENREGLTFAQAEGAENLPTQLQRKEISDELSSLLWAVIHGSLDKALTYSGSVYPSLQLYSPWKEILREWWVLRKFRNVDEFPEPEKIMGLVKKEVTSKEYVRVYDFLQFVIRSPTCPDLLEQTLSAILARARAPYRIVNKTFVPIATNEEAHAISRALEVARAAAAPGPAVHLANATTALSKGAWAEAIRESIHAVESAAKSIEPTTATLGPALDRLQSSIGLNPALKRAFSTLYGFTSDEKGIRHSLVFESEAKVGELDAIFMYGACASFVSYLIGSQMRRMTMDRPISGHAICRG